jgi:tetratricopeptide (TPR) repeat protein
MDEVPGRLSRWGVPLAPAAVSLVLSLSTVGSTVYWQDSGFYLTAVHEFSVLHPHGRVLYLLLCKAWTFLVAPLAGFTLAVHLFSSLCAAAAAGTLALAAREFLARFLPDAPRGLPAAGGAVVVASGYSFWHSGVLAKDYALFYFLLALLLWLMLTVRTKRGFRMLGAVLGFSWAAHPAAALLVPAMLAYGWVRRDRIREWGWAWAASIVGIAALCAFSPALLLPAIAARESPANFGDPRTPASILRYLAGDRLTESVGAFAFDAERFKDAARYVWEEYLGVGLALLGAGLAALARKEPRLLALLAAWVVPTAGIALFYVAETYLDMWLVADFIPLGLVVAAGLASLAKAHRHAPAAAAAAAVLWAVAANHADLNLRGYDVAETYGRALLRNADPNSILLLSTDDGVATVHYLQFVRGERADVRVVLSGYLGLPWYDAILDRRYGLRPPPWEAAWRAMPGISMDDLGWTAMINEHAAPGRPVFVDRAPDRRFLRPDLGVVIAGLLWKVAPKSEIRLEGRYWDLPDPRAVARTVRRERGQWLRFTPAGIVSTREPYEHRLLLKLLHARLRLADAGLETAPSASLQHYQLVGAVHPKFREDPQFLTSLGRALLGTGQPQPAEVALREAAQRAKSPLAKAIAGYYRGETARALGREDEARAFYTEALRTEPLDETWKKRIEARLRQP